MFVLAFERFFDFFRFGISMQDLDFTAFCQARCLVGNASVN